ncbi:hypothetical protein Nmel_000460, partial [Mimus melanotis]
GGAGRGGAGCRGCACGAGGSGCGPCPGSGWRRAQPGSGARPRLRAARGALARQPALLGPGSSRPSRVWLPRGL